MHAYSFNLPTLQNWDFVRGAAVLTIEVSAFSWVPPLAQGLLRDLRVRWAQRRLQDLETRLDTREYLEEQFTAGDLQMTTVLRVLRTTDLPGALPALVAYQARCEARPAFQDALRAHMATFQINQPAPSQSG